jgi:hypothetical protein
MNRLKLRKLSKLQGKMVTKKRLLDLKLLSKKKPMKQWMPIGNGRMTNVKQRKQLRTLINSREKSKKDKRK